MVPTYKWPHCPISVFINKIDVTWYHCNDICKGKATPSNYYPVFPTFAQKFNFWPFFNNCACSWATHWSHLRYIDKTRCCCNDIGWTIKKCKLAFSASSRLATIEIFLPWKLQTKYYLWAKFEDIWSMSKLSKLDI